MGIKTIFLDRDGVINEEVNYLFKKQDFKFIDGVFEACKYFLDMDYEIIIVTNQSGISRGYYSENDYFLITDWMLKKFKDYGIKILDVFYCPHNPKSNCKCRKPKPGMFINAQIKHNIDMNNSWMIGDKEIDITAANSAGINKTILVRSGHVNQEAESKANFFLDSIKSVTKVIRE
jgi:D-glycero-D-manno-heptose 1,7-bisphosphate phosphatase